MVSLRSTRLFCAFLISSLLAACGSDSNPNPGNGIGAGAAPTITSTIPSNNGAGVAVNVKIAATFTAPTFTVKQGAAAVSGSVAYSGSTATFTPSTNLGTSAGFTATISTGAK